MRYVRLILSLIFLTLKVVVCADDNLMFKHLNINDGLLHNSVTSIHQDHLGYIWIGTQQGLNRYDGNKVDSYLREDVDRNFINRITNICQVDTKLCISSKSSLYGFDLRTKSFFDFIERQTSRPFSRKIIYDLSVDSSRRVWVLGAGGLESLRIESDGSNNYLSQVLLGDRFIINERGLSVLELNDGRCLVSSEKGFFIVRTVDALSTTYVGIEADYHPGIISRMYIVDDQIWAFANQILLRYRLDGDVMTLVGKETYPRCKVNNVEQSDTQVWVSSNVGIFSIDKRSLEVKSYSHSSMDPTSVASDNTSDMILDFNDNLWVSSWATGVSFASIRPKKFKTLRSIAGDSQTLPNEYVSAIHQDSEGRVYVATKFGGISLVDIGNNRVIKNIDIDTASDRDYRSIIYSLCSDDRYIYAFTNNFEASITRIDKRSHSVETIYNLNQLASFSMVLDSHNNIWIAGLQKGLYHLKMEQGRVVRCTQMLNDESSGLINYVHCNNRSNEVIVSSNNGIYRYMLDQNGEIEQSAHYVNHRDPDLTLKGCYLWCIAQERDSIYWVGTFGQGLKRIVLGERESGEINEFQIESFNSEQGIHNNVIEGVVVDHNDIVWCSGNNISYFNYRTKNFYNYYENYGVQGNQFATGSKALLSSGEVLFGGTKGLNHFRPFYDSAKRNRILFTRLYIDDDIVGVGRAVNDQVVLDKEIEIIGGLTFNHDNNNFAIDFSSLNYTTTNTVRYRYRLEGYDKTWQEIDANAPRHISYRHIPPGNYMLVVESGNNVQSMQVARELPITVLKPRYMTTPLMILYAVVIFLLGVYAIYGLYQWMKMKSDLRLSEAKEAQIREMTKTKIDFFTNVSHEFKTPLTLINAAVDKLTKSESVDGATARSIDDIKRNNKRLLNLIGELMDFQNIAMSHKRLSLKRININNFIYDISCAFHPWGQRNNLDIRLHSLQEIIETPIDSEILTKILYNLISNSVKYSKEGGVVEISYEVNYSNNISCRYANARRMFDRLNKSDKYLVVKVVDDGAGIPSKTLDMIFEEYPAITANRSSRGQISSGVGLPFVKSLLELYAGGYILSSEEGRGTEFIILLPLFEEEESTMEPDFNVSEYIESYTATDVNINLAELSSGDSSKPCILFVDDNYEILSMLSDYFRHDYYLKFAGNGAEAMQICNEHLPDIVVSDIMMPEMNGYELCRALKSQISTCYIPVVLLTACTSVDQQRQGIDDGADFYIPKPFYFEILSSAINNLLSRRTLTPQPMNPSAQSDEVGSQGGEDAQYRKFVERLSSIIEEHISESDFTVDNLCLEIGASRSKLYSLIKSNEGISLGDFIKRIRMTKAAELLRSREMTISEVAYAVGITSPSFFSRTFKEYHNISPSEFVKHL